MIKKEESDLKLVEKLARELREDIRRLKKAKELMLEHQENKEGVE